MAETSAPHAAAARRDGARHARSITGARLLDLYLSFRAAGEPSRAEAWPPRPAGPFVWFHLADATETPAVAELLRRLRQERREVHALVTGAGEGDSFPPGTTITAPPGEERAVLAHFLDHWRPDVAVFAGGELSPMAIQQTGQRGIPAILIDGQTRADSGGWRWWPGVGRALVQGFERIFVQDEAAARRFRRLGAAHERVEVVGRMEEGQGALSCTEAERDALAGTMNARPRWLAVALPRAELAAVLGGHREALSLRHRLLLIVVPEPVSSGPEMAAAMAAEGWDVALRSLDEEPGEEDQIYVADTEGELGLWYRLSPITYLGGTLSGRGAARHPYEAAALGSAILHGPKTGAHAAAYARLGRAGAARVLKGAPQLGQALGEMLAPDRAAQMAHAAWDVTSSGAEVTDRIAQYLLATLDAPAGRTG